MKIKVLLALTAMSFLFCACPQVDPDPDPVDPDPVETEELVMVKRISVYENGKLSLRHDYDYDAQGRVKHIYMMCGESIEVATITYANNLVKLDSDEIMVSYGCNDNGRLECVQWSPNNGISTLIYEYDEFGYISAVGSTNDTEKTSIIALDGNYTYWGWYYAEYTDYPNKYSVDMNWILCYYSGVDFLDHTYGLKFENGYSKNLIKNMISEDCQKQLTYTFDDLSHVTDIKCQIIVDNYLEELDIKIEY